MNPFEYTTELMKNVENILMGKIMHHQSERMPGQTNTHHVERRTSTIRVRLYRNASSKVDDGSIVNSSKIVG